MTTIQVYSAFPGVGKSYLTSKYGTFQDVDSSTFDKDPAVWPNNYVEYIKAQVQAGRLVLVSSHEPVRQSLQASGIPFILFYPSRDCKAEYLERYRQRKSPQQFIDLVDALWDVWIGECEQWSGPKVEMSPRSFLSDYLLGPDRTILPTSKLMSESWQRTFKLRSQTKQ